MATFVAMVTHATVTTHITIVTMRPSNNVCYHTLYNLQLLLKDYEQIVKLFNDFNGADLRKVCTKAG